MKGGSPDVCNAVLEQLQSQFLVMRYPFLRKLHIGKAFPIILDAAVIFLLYVENVGPREVVHHVEIDAPVLEIVDIGVQRAVAFLERLSVNSPDIPVIGHPLMGRFHVVCSDDRRIGAITKTVLALGGKIPVEWGTGYGKGITGLFTGAELSVAMSLKHELDPDGILNPHLSIV